MTNNKLARWAGFFFVVLLVNTAYVWAFATPTIFYMANVLFHLGLGLALAFALVILLRKQEPLRHGTGLASFFFLVSLVLGLYLTWAGNLTPNRWILWAHIGTSGLGLLLLIPFFNRK